MIKGLYVHIPFCAHICSYCDFVKCRYSFTMSENYLNSLQKEIDEINQDEFDSIYIGGGTPTALEASQLEKLLTMLAKFKVNIEYTIEINPETFSLEKAQILKKYGINRVSIGIQSFDEELLKHMSRKHTNQDVFNTFSYLKEVGIKNRSIDLMYGFQNQTLSTLQQDLQKVVLLDVTHISIYALEIYPHTEYGIKHYQKVDDETDYLMYQTIVDYLNEHSYKQYETSNFALGHYQSYHNRLYWTYEDFIGVGMGASGKVGDIRYDNTDSFIDYNKGKYRKNETRLTLKEQQFEAIMMNLRLIEGINVANYNKRFDIDLLRTYQKQIRKHFDLGNLVYENGYLKTTEKGKLILNDILVDFME